MNIYVILGVLMLIAGLGCWSYVFKCLYIMFRTRIVVDLPLNELFKTFRVTEKGGFAIWEEGPMLKKSPMAFSTPQIINTDHHQPVKLSRSYGNATKTSFTRASRMVYFCELDAGNYVFEVHAGSSLGKLDQAISNTIERVVTVSKAPASEYRIQLRKSLNKRQRLLIIPAVFIGLFLFNIGLFTVLGHTTGVHLEGALGM